LILNVCNIVFKYNTKPVLKGISFNVEPGNLVCLVGPNGSGKSTLIRCISSILKPHEGRILIENKDVNLFHTRELARLIGYVPQGMQQIFPVNVLDFILMGRRPHASWRSSTKDLDKIFEVMQLMGLEDLCMRDCSELSGGQQQKVMIARALAQDPGILLLDEPTSALDICHQLEVMEILLDLVRSKNIIVVIAIHDLNIASRYSDGVIMLKEGAIFDSGSPEYVLNEVNIASVYGVFAGICKDFEDKPSIIPIRRIKDNEKS
jgi:iron complex transport system ATP-binding protein